MVSRTPPGASEAFEVARQYHSRRQCQDRPRAGKARL